MIIGQELLKELELEALVTRRYLERVPFEKLEFRPSEKSESLGRLAIHIAEIIAWWTSCVESDKLDFIDFEPKDIQSTEELLNYFDDLLESAKKSLSEANNEEFEKVDGSWRRNTIYFTKKASGSPFLHESFGSS